jgi:hypothetical protein
MRVFLSSTYADLIEHRRCVTDAIERLGHQTGRMEVFGARPEEPSEACVREIDQCDLFVGIYAHRYGYVPQGSEVSITELEFQYAKDKAKPIFCFLVNEDYPWPPRMIEIEPGRTKLSRFKDAFQTKFVRETFTTPEDLAVKVATSVGRFIAEVSAPLYPVVTGLRNLIKETSDGQESDRQAVGEALSATVEIANLTLQYLADQRRTGQRDYQRERALANGWSRAGAKLIDLNDPPRELVNRYFLKAEFWSFPERWTDERIKASRIGLDEIAEESRSLLLNRTDAHPPAL